MDNKRVGIKEVVYTPESRIRHPSILFKEMFRDLISSHELAWRLFLRDISSKYRQSLLGFLWVFLPPIFTAGIFIMLQRQAILNVKDTAIPYPAFALVGTVLWQTFVDSINAPLRAVTASKPIIAKIKIPYEALILSAIGEVLFNLSMKIIIILLVFLFFKLPLTTGLILAPFAISVLILHGIFIGLLLTPIGLLYKDVQNGLVIATNLWFFLTPVIYPTPTSFPLSLIAKLNPVSPLIIVARDLITRGIISDITLFAGVTLFTLFGLLFVWILYRISIPIVIERMSA
ncbi:MAG: ABC transporter permease [Nitrospirae bacterium]|nr:MAG: ABC transporter permease [Nitrospirota bacterium]